mmetsp:Transcript_75786/g.225940  ORF Transcript_75786/g.225940 Transcript_75786/m.225940 type:complete len:299 (-) Transcript_75786:7-903(-)
MYCLVPAGTQAVQWRQVQALDALEAQLDGGRPDLHLTRDDVRARPHLLRSPQRLHEPLPKDVVRQALTDKRQGPWRWRTEARIGRGLAERAMCQDHLQLLRGETVGLRQGPRDQGDRPGGLEDDDAPSCTGRGQGRHQETGAEENDCGAGANRSNGASVGFRNAGPPQPSDKVAGRGQAHRAVERRTNWVEVQVEEGVDPPVLPSALEAQLVVLLQQRRQGGVPHARRVCGQRSSSTCGPARAASPPGPRPPDSGNAAASQAHRLASHAAALRSEAGGTGAPRSATAASHRQTPGSST